jgi:hypothetical protein
MNIIQKRLLMKTLVIGTITFFIIVSMIPNICGNSIIKINRDVLVFDDFNDNIKNTELWEEYNSQGQWYEQNQRTEILVNSAGGPQREAIETIFIPNVKITEDIPLTVSVDMISNVQSTTDLGQLRFHVTDGSNYIMASYTREDNRLRLIDYNDPGYTIIGSRDDGSWSNQIEIYSNRYQVHMDEFSSGWIYDNIFSTDSQIKIRIGIKLEESAGTYLKAGFDNALIEGTANQPPDIPDRPNGMENGKAGVEYTYKTKTNDPEDGEVYYKWDWGDGSFSDWIGPINSGVETSASHVWGKGNFIIKVKAKDEYELESDWSDPLVISMPRNKASYSSCWLRFIEIFPILQRMLALIY